jgi:hypothetical protein
MGCSTERLVSSEQFLSKQKLKELFPDEENVILRITYRRRRFTVGSESKGKSKNKKEKKGKHSLHSERFIVKHRLLNLF